ncbi:MAG: hypothetical protein WCS31_12550 [Verrucomicrobiae bacterium]
MLNYNVAMELSAAVFLTLWAGTARAEVVFGHSKLAGTDGVSACLDFSKQGEFFSTNDYGYTPEGEDQITGAKLGYKWCSSIYRRGQNPRLTGNFRFGTGWLSDGGNSLCGVIFDKPLKPTWGAYEAAAGQFARMTDQKPLFDSAVVYWGDNVPRLGSWGACILDADGNFKRLAFDAKAPLLPRDQTTFTFSPTTVKKLYLGVQGPDNFVEVMDIALLLHNRPLVDNHLSVFQMDAYQVVYSNQQPGTIEQLHIANTYFGRPTQIFPDAQGLLRKLAPFVELDGKRLHAAPGDYTVTTTSDGRADTLTYTLKIAGADVTVTARFGIELKDTVKFSLKAKGLPQGARLGLEMQGSTEVFANYSDPAAAIDIPAKGQTFSTPAGSVGLAVEGADQAVANCTGKVFQIDLFAKGNTLAAAFSLPIGPEAGVQPEMLTYNWRPALADQGDEGLAPFKAGDLELMETVNLADPNDPHPVYDVSNDPLLPELKKNGVGCLQFVNTPEKGQVPLTKVLGQMCRAINANDTTYFRFNLRTRFSPRVPYLIVVEHAFDKERRGEFHAVGLDPSGTRGVSLWGRSAPFGALNTGKGSWTGTFKKEPVFYFSSDAREYPENTVVSLCFSNHLAWGWYKTWLDVDASKNLPEGLAVKSVSVYRIKHMPQLPELGKLLPKGPRRHLSVFSETTSPWALDQLPKLAGYDAVWTNHQNPAQLLFLQIANTPRPSWQDSFHAGTLASETWLCDRAARQGVGVKIPLSSLFTFGFEGSGRDSFMGVGLVPGEGYTPSLPLRPTPDELAVVTQALDKSLAALAPYSSFRDIMVDGSALSLFTRRNLEDFSKETGIKFAATPAPVLNARDLLAAPQATVDAWTKWVCQARYKQLAWLLKTARKHNPGLYLTIGQNWYCNNFQFNYYRRPIFDAAALKEKGIADYLGYLKLIGIDPALYGDDGFSFAIEKQEAHTPAAEDAWPLVYGQDKWFDQLRRGFGGGLCVSHYYFDESPKPLVGWTCHYIKSQQAFRRNLLEALLHANARDIDLQTYDQDPYRGRLNDLRTFAVPFQLLPFAQPEPYAGTIDGKAVINKYGDRHGLMNPSDQPADVTLTLPDGTNNAFDLSGGVRQRLTVTGKTVKIHLEPWALKTLELQ